MIFGHLKTTSPLHFLFAQQITSVPLIPFLIYLTHHILVLVLFIEIFVPVEFSSSKSTFVSADGASLSDFKTKNTKINLKSFFSTFSH